MMGMIVMVLVGLVLDSHAHADVLDATPYIDNIATSTNEFYPRETGDITVKFSGKGNHQFHPGDELVFDIPKALKSFKQKMWLEDYAQVRIENERVHVKFTGKVNGRINIKGQLKFGVKGSEELQTGSRQVVPLHLGTQIKNYPSVTVKGYAEENTGRVREAADFAYKGGNVHGNDVRLMDWYIVVNPNRMSLADDVIVRDNLGFGHELVPGSIKLGSETINATHGSLTMDKHSFQLILNKSYASGRGIGIYYQTRLTSAGEKSKTISNSFTADYQIANLSKQSIVGSGHIKNVFMTGMINGEYQPLEADIVEENNIDEQETLGTVEELVTETAVPSIEANQVTEQADKMQVEVHANAVEENNIDELESLGAVEELVTETAVPSIETNQVTEQADKTQIKVHANAVEENNMDEQETLGTVEELVTETAVPSIEANQVTEQADKTQVEVQANAVEENNIDEQETFGTVEELVTETAVPSIEANQVTEQADKTQVEVHANPVEENNIDEQETFGTVEELVTENTVPSIEANQVTEQADKTQVEVHANAVEENNIDEQETLGTVEELVTETAVPSIEANQVTEQADKTQVEVHANAVEENNIDEQETLGAVEELVTENAIEVIDEAEAITVTENMPVEDYVDITQSDIHENDLEEINTADVPVEMETIIPNKIMETVSGSGQHVGEYLTNVDNNTLTEGVAVPVMHMNGMQSSSEGGGRAIVLNEALPNTGSRTNYALIMVGLLMVFGLWIGRRNIVK